jgi:hypothetical protein
VSTCLFIGPTLRRDEVAAALDAVVLPPAKQGDVYRAALNRPTSIGIVDGYFGGAPSVWHKEILWALSQGIPVFGSASMGALRAAELTSFGMRGVGRIFEMYRDGVLEDDDEVALIHGPAETGFAALSEPMVNIRATLAAAEASGVIGPSLRHRLELFAKSLFFPQRAWPAMIAEARSLGEAEAQALEQWLPQGRVDRKRLDALEMLRVMGERPGEQDPRPPGFGFELTHFWDEFVTRSDSGPYGEHSRFAKAILEELRLEGGDAYERFKGLALSRLFALREANRSRLKARPEDMRPRLTRLRSELGLFSRAELEKWLECNRIDAATLEQLIEDLVRSEEVSLHFRLPLERQLIDELRFRGAYERLAERARKKEEALAEAGVAEPEETRPSVIALREWYFERRQSGPIPNALIDHVRELGFETVAEFDRALWREWKYLNTGL